MAEDPVLQRALTGDKQALAALCEREWHAVYGLAYRTLQNRAEAQDLTQEVFARALTSLHRYRITEVPFRAYLITIAKNMLRDRWRRRAPALASLDDATFLPDHGPGPELLAVAHIEQAVIERALAALPDDYQAVIRLRIIDGMTSNEVGALMGKSPEAIRQLQRRALAMLRSFVDEELRV